MTTLTLLTLLAAPPVPVSAVAYSADGKTLAVGTRGQVVLANPATGDDTATLPVDGRITALAFSKTGRLAVAAGEPGKSGVVRFIDSQAQTTEFVAHKDAVYTLAFSPDGKTLATAGYDRTIKLWNGDAYSGKLLLTLTDHSDAVYAVAFSPDGKLLASAAADRAVKVWDVATGKRLYTLGDPTDWVYAVAWHPDGKRLAAAGVDRSVRVWEATAAGGKLLKSAFAHEKPVVRLAFGPDGKTLYSAGEDRTIKAWDADNLTETRVFPAQPDAVLALAVRPDGKQLAVGRFDGVCQLYDTATGKPGPTPVPVKPKPAAVTGVSPTGVVRGTTVRLTLTGTRLDTVTGVTSSVPSVAVKLIAGTATRREVELTVPPTAPVGPLELVANSPAGPSMPVKVSVDRFPVVAETGITESARTAMPVTLPATVVGSIDRAGDTDYVRFDAAPGQQIGVQATVTGKLDPVLTITDADGHVVATGTTAAGYVIPKAGRYAVGVRDRDYRGGPDFAYRLHVGPVPVATSVFPLGVQRGRAVNVHIDGVNLGSPDGQTVRVTVPADAKISDKVPVPVAVVNGETPLGSPAVVVGEFPAAVVADAGEIRAVPGTADGILAKPGESQTVRFAAKKGSPLAVEVHARRLGSALDSAVEILDAAGKPVQRATLRCVAKTFVTFRDHDSAQGNIRLDAWNELATNDYLFVNGEVMRIKQLPGHPDADCNFVVVAGQRAAFLGTTPTAHAQNENMFKVEFHPPGTTFPPNGMPVFPVAYRNDDGGAGFGKDSWLLFDPPADGVYQVRVSDARGLGGAGFGYRLTVRPPRPDFTLTVSARWDIWQGGAVPVTVTATRLDGFDGEIVVKPEGLTAPFSAPATVIEAGQTTAVFPLAADGPGTAASPFRLTGSATIQGKAVSREATGGMPKAVPVADVSATTDTPTLAIKPGGEARIRMRIERQKGFTARVPLDVKGLPHGVTVQNIGLNGILCTEKDTEREIVLAAEPWVKPMAVPVVFLARVEKNGAEHATRPVMLRVGE